MIQSVKHLPAARVTIPESWNEPHMRGSVGSLLLPLPLPVTPPACTLSLSLSLKNILFIYLRARVRRAQVGRGTEGEAGSPTEQGSPCGALSQDPEIMT